MNVLSVQDNPLAYVSFIYFAALVVTVPISGGYLNPAITVASWIGNSGSKEVLESKTNIVLIKHRAWKTYLAYCFMQLCGGMGGMGAGRAMRFEWVPTNQTDAHYCINYQAWSPPVQLQMVNPEIGATTEILFCEIFASFLLCTIFMTLKFRSISRGGTITNERDSVLIALALTATTYGATSMIRQVSGTFVNPAISFSQLITSLIFVPNTPLSPRYIFARLIGPFIGAIFAGMFFLFQREVLHEADNLFQPSHAEEINVQMVEKPQINHTLFSTQTSNEKTQLKEFRKEE